MDRTPKRACIHCGSLLHYKTFCRQAPKKPIITRQPIPQESKKTNAKRVKTANQWFRENPPDETNHWECYLQISVLCPKRLSRGLLTLEHVRPKVKNPELRFVVSNIKPSCSFCNRLKGSRTLEQLVVNWPYLVKYLV